MGILDTALQKLPDPSSSIAMAEDTIRDMRRRQQAAITNTADRVQEMWGRFGERLEGERERAHEWDIHESQEQGALERIQEQIAAERQMRAADRMSEVSLREMEDATERELAELRREHERMITEGRQEFDAEENEAQRALEWRIAQLQAQVDRERIAAMTGAEGGEDAAPEDWLYDGFFNAMRTLHATSNPDDWQFDPNQGRFVFVGEMGDTTIEENLQRLYSIIDANDSLTPEQKERLKQFAADYMPGMFPQMPDAGGEETGGGGKFSDWIRGHRPQAIEQSNRAVEEAGGLHSMPTEPSGFEPGVPERVYNHLTEEHHPAWRGGSYTEKRLESDIISTINRLRGLDLSDADEGVVDYVESEFERARSTLGNDSDTFRHLLNLLRPIEPDNTRAESGPAQGGMNFGR